MDPAQRVVAGELWREMSGLLSGRLAARNAELARTNEDLDSFAHAAAHDLKEPLRGISNAAAFIVEDAGAVLDATSLRRLTTVRRLAERMDGLLDSLLHFSLLGQVGLEQELLSLDEVVDDALLVAGDRLAEQGVTLVRPAPLPRLRADRRGCARCWRTCSSTRPSTRRTRATASGGCGWRRPRWRSRAARPGGR